MPNHKSAKKRVRTNEVARVRNRSIRTAVRTAIKKVRSAKNKEEAVKSLRETSVLIDKACQKGVYHPKNAARKKSRLAHHVNVLAQ